MNTPATPDTNVLDAFFALFQEVVNNDTGQTVFSRIQENTLAGGVTVTPSLYNGPSGFLFTLLLHQEAAAKDLQIRPVAGHWAQPETRFYPRNFSTETLADTLPVLEINVRPDNRYSDLYEVFTETPSSIGADASERTSTSMKEQRQTKGESLLTPWSNYLSETMVELQGETYVIASEPAVPNAQVLMGRLTNTVFKQLAGIDMFEGRTFEQSLETPDSRHVDGSLLVGAAPSKVELRRHTLGGITTESLLTLLIEQWLSQEFLGETLNSLEHVLGSNEAVAFLLSLLTRRHSSDWLSLFRFAVTALIDPALTVQLETAAPVWSELGGVHAQLGETLALGGMLVQDPVIAIYLPFYRVNDCGEVLPFADAAQKRLELLENLFVPVHLSVRRRWARDEAWLGQSSYLSHEETADSEWASRLAHEES